jgi:hypothetical protein
MAQSTTAGVVTAFGVLALLMTSLAALITAFATRRTSKRVEDKVDHGNAQGFETHKLVNQRFTDLENYVLALQRQIRATGQEPTEDQSKGQAPQ